MVQFTFYLNNDWFKIGRFGEKHVKNINMALAVIASIFLFSFLFYLVIYSSTNFGSLDNLEDYAKNSEFERINLAMKIMPSYNTEKNALYMEHSTDIHKTSIPNSLSIMENFKLSNTFFFVNQTSVFFPKLMYKKENLPVGDSISMCIAVSWAPRERGYNWDIMKPVTSFPLCKEASTGKSIWNSDDPLNGIDVPVWRQKVTEIDCTTQEDCDNYCKACNAVYIGGKNTKRCYSYEVLETICIVIEYDEMKEDFVYSGGCYKDNRHYLMLPAEQNREYLFEGIEIEVRNKKDPVIKAGELSDYTFSFGESWNFLAIILNILIFFCFLGLSVIGYLVFQFRRKYSAGSLLAENSDKKASEPAQGLGESKQQHV